MMCVIAPEYLTAMAVYEFWGARRVTKTLRQLGFPNTTLVHGFFLNMGGFVLQSGQRYCHVTIEDVTSAIDASSTGILRASRHSNDKTAAYPPWTHEVGNTAKDQINDLAASDVLTKTIACVQALWFVTQVISRLCEHRAITLLEVSTSAYVLSAVVAYAAWWKKPQGCNLPIIVSCTEDQIPPETGARRTPYELHDFDKYLWGGANIACITSMPGLGFLFWFIIVCPFIYGAIHLASWNVTLPSDVELWMWRASALYCTAVGPLLGVAVAIEDVSTYNQKFFGVLLAVFLGFYPYILVRSFMVVEIFVSLRALPYGVYESVQWSSFIPHI